MCYAVMAHVTDFDVWHISAAPVTVDAVVKTLEKNTQLAQEAVRLLLRRLPSERPCDCATALAGAIITRTDVVPAATLQAIGSVDPEVHSDLAPCQLQAAWGRTRVAGPGIAGRRHCRDLSHHIR